MFAQQIEGLLRSCAILPRPEGRGLPRFGSTHSLAWLARPTATRSRLLHSFGQQALQLGQRTQCLTGENQRPSARVWLARNLK
jgi:hypothetical protein